MNLFILDYDHDKNAEYHIDKHVTKMQLEGAQLLSTTLWVDNLLGYVPRKLTSDELQICKDAMKDLPSIENREFLRYKITHPNHPCAVWVRESYSNFEWANVYVNSLNEEAIYRGYKPHASCIEVNKMPYPTKLLDKGMTPFAECMPDDYKTSDVVESYRKYYKNDKTEIASWKNRETPYWW